MSIDEGRQRRLRDIRVELFGMTKGTNMVEYFAVPHHGSAGALVHADLLPGTRIVLGGDPEQPALQAVQTLKLTVVESVYISDFGTLNTEHLPRYFNKSDHNTPTESTAASPDITVFFLFLS